MLYDAGSLGRSEAGAWQISQALWASGVSSIDAVVVSHADQDHFNAGAADTVRTAVIIGGQAGKLAALAFDFSQGVDGYLAA